MPRSLAGSRIREARRRSGHTQAALAKMVGISPSYLNLIEHNRRRIGGALLNALAQTLEVRAADLSEGGNPTAVPDLRTALADQPGVDADPETAESLAGRFPDWAQLIVAQHRRIRDQRDMIRALSDRLAHDPFLSENVHAMLSNITAIRSTAGILSTVPDVPEPQRNRFYDSMSAESDRLSTTAQNLADYLGAAATVSDSAMTAEETLDHFLGQHAYSFAEIDALTERAHTAEDLSHAIAALIDAEVALAEDTQARDLVEGYLRAYAVDAAAMPLTVFVEMARQTDFDPTVLSAQFGQPIPAVFRRLAALHREGLQVPRFGLLVVTASGYPLIRQPLPSFPLPRHGNACPLWPVFRGFARPGEAMVDVLTRDSDDSFVALTYAAPRQPVPFGGVPDLASSMLFVAKADAPFGPAPTAPARLVGTSCRICTRAQCPARAQAQLLL